MRLGDHFLNPATSRVAPVKHVKFKVVGLSLANGEPLIADAEATFVFCDESQRQLAFRDAHKEMKALYGDAHIPQERLNEEILYQFLFRALRESSSDGYRVMFANSVKELKNALVYKTAAELDEQYNAWIDEEFPSDLDAGEFEELIKDAEGKSLAVLLKESGFYKIRRALPSLAIRFGR